MLTPWNDDVAEVNTRFSAASAQGGVAWLAGHGGLARVTQLSAEHAATGRFPRELGDTTGSKKSRHAGLVVIAPNHVMLSTRDISVITPFEVSQVITRDIGPIGRACEVGRSGRASASVSLPSRAASIR